MSFTPIQQATLEKVYELLGEHFEGSLFAVVTSVEGKEDKEEVSTIYYRGGHIQALGLATKAFHRLSNKPPDQNAPEGEIP